MSHFLLYDFTSSSLKSTILIYPHWGEVGDTHCVSVLVNMVISFMPSWKPHVLFAYSNLTVMPQVPGQMFSLKEVSKSVFFSFICTNQFPTPQNGQYRSPLCSKRIWVIEGTMASIICQSAVHKSHSTDKPATPTILIKYYSLGLYFVVIYNMPKIQFIGCLFALFFCSFPFQSVYALQELKGQWPHIFEHGTSKNC